jgi:hypothetical protein
VTLRKGRKISKFWSYSSLFNHQITKQKYHLICSIVIFIEQNVKIAIFPFFPLTLQHFYLVNWPWRTRYNHFQAMKTVLLIKLQNLLMGDILRISSVKILSMQDINIVQKTPGNPSKRPPDSKKCWNMVFFPKKISSLRAHSPPEPDPELGFDCLRWLWLLFIRKVQKLKKMQTKINSHKIN